MRVIAGQYRGRVLRGPPSITVRPTSDRLRETLFNILAPRIADTRFLDLCAGSGAVGIEALSRGARFATFVERSRKLCALVEANLDLCLVPEEQSDVICSDAFEFVRKAKSRGASAWDICYYDPPYATDYGKALFAIGAPDSAVLSEDGLLIAEHHHKTILPDQAGSLRRWRLLKQGDSCLSFYEKD